jgi:cytoskeletal protein CcmA (bactofilin family)
MSNLSNLMISGSYLGLINLQDSTQNLASQSGYVELQDGLGDNIGISIDASNNNVRVNNTLDVGLTLGVTGSSHFRNNVDIDGDLDVSGSFVHSGSIDVVGDVTIEGDITAHTGSFDTINTRVLNVTIETASVIFSSGSNKLGDEETDRQDLVGQVIVSGTLGVEGNSAFTGSLTVSNEISSSTVNDLLIFSR